MKIITPIRLKTGDRAPQFAVRDVFGKPVDLSSHSRRYVMLVFLRYSGCPWCNLTLHRLTLEYPMLARQGCKVVAFVQSDADNIKRNIYDRHAVKPPFPIVADPDMAVYRQYGVHTSVRAIAGSIKDIPHWMHSVRNLGFRQTEVDGSLLVVPAMFLVAPRSQQIVRAEYSSSFYDHQTFTGIYETLVFESDETARSNDG